MDTLREKSHCLQFFCKEILRHQYYASELLAVGESMASPSLGVTEGLSPGKD